MHDCTRGVTLHRVQPEKCKTVLQLCSVNQNAFCCPTFLIKINKFIKIKNEPKAQVTRRMFVCSSTRQTIDGFPCSKCKSKICRQGGGEGEGRSPRPLETANFVGWGGWGSRAPPAGCPIVPGAPQPGSPLCHTQARPSLLHRTLPQHLPPWVQVTRFPIHPVSCGSQN